VRCLVIAASLLLSAAGLFADGADRDKIIGFWQSQGGGDTRASWMLQSKGDVLHITRVENDRKLADFECNTVGRECKVKEADKPMKVSIWFNGPKLVIMETRGNDVLKRRFHATDDGKEIEMETIPIVPQGKPEVVRLQRAPASN
jgi:hypothetical protein